MLLLEDMETAQCQQEGKTAIAIGPWSEKEPAFRRTCTTVNFHTTLQFNHDLYIFDIGTLRTRRRGFIWANQGREWCEQKECVRAATFAAATPLCKTLCSPTFALSHHSRLSTFENRPTYPTKRRCPAASELIMAAIRSGDAQLERS